MTFFSLHSTMTSKEFDVTMCNIKIQKWFFFWRIPETFLRAECDWAFRLYVLSRQFNNGQGVGAKTPSSENVSFMWHCMPTEQHTPKAKTLYTSVTQDTSLSQYYTSPRNRRGVSSYDLDQLLVSKPCQVAWLTPDHVSLALGYCRRHYFGCIHVTVVGWDFGLWHDDYRKNSQ